MRFEVAEEGAVAHLEYRLYKGDIALMHTEVPAVLEGKGVASALVRYAFAYAAEHRLPVMVYCPYVAAFVQRHPEYQAQVDNKYTRPSL
ncbi:MAG TPA: GNAT family N-acetyltransferase [Chitinophaga sp.]